MVDEKEKEKDDKTPPKDEKKKRKRIEKEFQTPSGTLVYMKRSRDISRVSRKLRSIEAKLIAGTISKIVRQVVVENKERTVCLLCCDYSKSKNILPGTENSTLRGSFAEFRWDRICLHLLKCKGLENATGEVGKELRQILHRDSLNGFLYELDGRKHKEMQVREKQAVSKNLEASIKQFNGMAKVEKNFAGLVSGVRIGDFDNVEFNSQTTLDYLITKLFAQNTLIPFSLVDSSSFKELLIYCGMLNFADFQKMAVSSYRVKEMVNVHAKKRVRNCMTDHLRTASCLGPLNLYLDGWQARKGNKLTGCIVKGVTGYSFPFKTIETSIKDDAITNVQRIEDIINGFKVDFNLDLNCVVTDNAGQLAKARRILKVRWPAISFETCWAHQFNRVCAKLFNCFKQTDAERRKKKVIMFYDRLQCFLAHVNGKMENKKSFKEKVEQIYGESKLTKFVSPICQTRWNSVYWTVASILKRKRAVLDYICEKEVFKEDLLIKKPLADASDQPEDEVGNSRREIEENVSFKYELLQTANDFLIQCDILATLMKPLSKAVLHFQGSSCNRSSVLHWLLKTFVRMKKYESDDYQPFVGMVAGDLEQRWHSAEQPLFWLTYAFDLRSFLIFREMTKSFPQLSSLFRYSLVTYYSKFMKVSLSNEEKDALRLEGLNFLNGVYDKHFRSSLINGEVLPRYWIEVRKRLGSESMMAELAVHVVNLHVTTADAERMFSSLGKSQNQHRASLGDETNMALYELRRYLIENKKLPVTRQRNKPLSHKELENVDGIKQEAQEESSSDEDNYSRKKRRKSVISERVSIAGINKSLTKSFTAIGEGVSKNIDADVDTIKDFEKAVEVSEEVNDLPTVDNNMIEGVREERRKFQVYPDGVLEEMLHEEIGTDDNPEDEDYIEDDGDLTIPKNIKEQHAVTVLKLEENGWHASSTIQDTAGNMPRNTDNGLRFRQENPLTADSVQERNEDFASVVAQNVSEHRGAKYKLEDFAAGWKELVEEEKKGLLPLKL